MKLGMKKKDLILIIGVIFIAVSAWGLHMMSSDSQNEAVVVKIDGKIVATYDLNDNQEISLNDGTNLLKIQDGTADMIEADCPDKLCVDQRVISKNHESIICLPNKVVVEVISESESSFDSMTN